MSKEQKFYNTLNDIFVGAKIEGEGGFVNLMRIKSSYYSKIREHLEKDINKALKKYPKFREELFDKLYSFFNRYFSKSGSIYFNYTPLFQNVYDKVYTDDKDVILFWKTHMLYYVKSDRIFNNLLVEFDGYKFFFDVSKLEYKKATEKRSLVYELKNVRKDGTIVFEVFYSERGKKTKIDEIKKALKKKGIKIKDEILERAFRTFEKQIEVDYFINKNAREFLKEQFKLWLYQYVFTEESEWPKERINQLQILKNIAYKIIDFISQFEDELVKIWEKPKFVRKSNYVITLDRIFKQKGGIEIIEKILKHKNFKEQVKEWKELGILEKEPKNLFENTLAGKQLKKEYQFLPIDTKYFKDLEIEILNLFDNLDQSLDGWLIKSENWQALNTILPKFKEKIQTIYIDPPFNKEQEADYFYSVKFKDATWITMLENRLRLARDLLKDTGSIFVRCDYNGNMYVRLLMNEIFGEENFRNEISVKRMTKLGSTVGSFNIANDSLFLFSKSQNISLKPITRNRICPYCKQPKEPDWVPLEAPGEGKNECIVIESKKFYARKNSHWTFKQDTIDEMYKKGLIRINKRRTYVDKYGNRVEGLPEYLQFPFQTIDDDWTDIPGYARNWEFQTENSEILLRRVIESTSNKNDLVMDFFLGSGTTTAVAHKLGRKWIGVEMGEHFYSVVLPRMKKVLAYDKSGISKEKDVKEKYSQQKAGGFFKYYELEQYDDTLRKTKYEESDLFEIPNQSPYSQYVFMKDKKMLDALEIDYKNNKVKVDLSKLYPDIDIAETLSNLRGKYIKKISKNEVEFEDSEKVDIKNLDYKIIKPLIWW